MSKRIWGITLTVSAFVIMLTIAYWYLGRNQITPPEEQNGTQLVEMLPAETRPDQVNSPDELADSQLSSADGSDGVTPDDYQFVLINNNNYIEVYKLPENEIYEYTDVIMDVLPADIQTEISQGKYLRDEEELYNFLENYTS